MSNHYSYIRVSTDTQAGGDQNGLKAQTDAIERYCVANSIPFESVTIFSDEGVSGATPIHSRLGLSACLESLSEGDTLIVPSLCRLSRDMMTSLLIEQYIEKKKSKLVSTKDEGTNSLDPSALLLKRILQSVNTYERNILRARTSAALQARKKRGLSTGHVPFGFCTDKNKYLILRPEEIETLQRMDSLRKDGLSYQKVADILNYENSLNRGGKKWTPKTVWNVYKGWNTDGKSRYEKLLAA